MQITVRFFASLREKMGQDTNTLEIQPGTTIQDVWDQVSGGTEKPANLLCALNMEYRDWAAVVGEGDEVAFFPPVTGGSV